MAALVLWLASLFYASYVLCQVPTLLESGPGVVKPSETLRLSCKVTGSSLTDSSYCWHWVRQQPGRGLQWLGEICSSGSTYYPEALKSKLSISRDTSKSEYYLEVRSMTVEDMATYYSARKPQCEEGRKPSYKIWM